MTGRAEALQQRAGSALRGWAESIETNARMDERAAPFDKVSEVVRASPPLHDFLRGKWLGHSFHPLLTDFPLGAWISVSLLDLFGGDAAKGPAQGLTGFGVAAAVPTALAGLADWSDTAGGARRVGVAHATMNTGILACYTASWLARRRSRHGLGVALALTGGSLAWASGYLGGHLSLVKKTGVANPQRNAMYESEDEEGAVSSTEREKDTEEEGQSGDVVHGGQDDPLGGGVADLEDSDEVTEGVPRQGDTPADER
ncbi:MAG: iron-sulfur protein [Actinomycetota bacterium]|nr:iron-sulfur protein [Actinomycetota bacterium]